MQFPVFMNLFILLVISNKMWWKLSFKLVFAYLFIYLGCYDVINSQIWQLPWENYLKIYRYFLTDFNQICDRILCLINSAFKNSFMVWQPFPFKYKHFFSCINIYCVLRKLFEHKEARPLAFKRLPRDSANVNCNETNKCVCVLFLHQN